jgi:uncharacterized membrane protein
MNTALQNPLPTVVLALVVGAIPSAIFSWVLAGLDVQSMVVETAGRFWLIWLLSQAVALALSAILIGVMTNVTVELSRGLKISLGDALMRTAPVIIPLVAFSILLGLSVMLGAVLLFVPGIMLYVAFSVGAPAIVAERVSVGRAFSRSRELTKGARWTVFALFLIMFIMLWLISWLTGLAGLSQTTIPEFTPVRLATLAIVGTITSLLWGTIQASLYVELREWKGGPDSDQLEQVFA